MIKNYSGRPGSGKSYNAVANILIPSLKQGRTVVTNLVLKKQEIYKDFPDANIFTFPMGLTKDDASKVFVTSNFPAGSVFIIDEAGKLFPAGWSISKAPDSLLTFFTEHRHVVGTDGKASEIFLLSQDVSQLAKWLKDLIDSTYIHKKLDKAGFPNHFAVAIYDGPVSMDRPSKTKFVDDAKGSYKPEIFKYYKSYTKNESLDDSALEKNPDKRSSYVGRVRNYLIFGSFVLVFGVFSIIYLFNSLFGSSDVPEASPSPSQSVSSNIQSYADSSITTDILSYSESYRLSGVVISKSQSFAIIENQNTAISLNLLDACFYEPSFSDWVCEYQGQKVSSFTGIQSRSQLMNLEALSSGDESGANGVR